jgi:hypothetical protein
MVIGSEAAYRARGCTHDSAGLAIPDTLAIGTRSDVDRVFQGCRNGSIVLRRDEQHRSSGANTLSEGGPRLGRICVVVLIGERELADLDDFRLQRRRRQFDQRMCDFPID